ncbi:MAG TPA: hypothetical protein DF774_10375 [Rheinheimera sp.]|uniref:DUF3693 domain-containing protein n=1 Tax=Rheinheimera sp. TaxID=1869214 RepID=UPI000EDBC6D6|nr:DUF3693 domain-containing protein [Rheinheimera sp.]HCU66152.1 hypothetical protein [Rheinheimera sp.]
MNFSSELIDKFKEIKGIKTDAEVAELIPEMNKGNLSKIRKGSEGRHLNEMQALWIAEQCKMDAALVLVELAAECAKTTTAQTVWHDLAKKLRATAKILVVATILMISGTSGHYPPQRIKYIP